MNKIAPYWKAVVGFVAPAGPLLINAMTDASDGGSVITVNEWLIGGITCVVTAAAVYAAPKNRDKEEVAQ